MTILIISINLISSSIIKIPFKIQKSQNFQDQSKEKSIRDMTFFVKLISSVELGNPLQKIETIFDLKNSNFYILNYCYNCSYFYSYNKSSSFFKTQIELTPRGIKNSFYAFETFYFYDGKTNNRKEVKDMLIYLPESNNKNNSLNIGLRFPDNINNDYQESFIQQLKHKNIINKYFWTMELYNKSLSTFYNNNYDGEFIFGDIINDYYAKNNKDFSKGKIAFTYTANINKKNEEKEKIPLDWGINFQAYYEQVRDNEKNNIFIGNSIFEFDFSINTIIGTFEYFRNIQRDFFNKYINNNICKTSFMRGIIYKYIYCYSEMFTINDLETFPSLNFKNKDLRYIFSLNYQDLFYLT